MWLSHCDYFLFLSLHECRFNEKGNKEKEVDLIMCIHHTRKGKKRNLTCKAKTIWCWLFYYKYTHAIEEKRGLVIILPIPIVYTRFTKKLKTRGSRSHMFIYYWRKEKKKEAPGTYYKGTHTYVLTSSHKRKEAAPQSCPILLLCELVVCFWIFTQFLYWTLCVANFFYNLEYYELVCNLVFYFPLFSHG